MIATAATLVLLGIALSTNNRALKVGLATVTVLLIIDRQWKFAVTQSVVRIVAVISILFFALLTNTYWKQTPLHGVYERLVSITDPLGQRAYLGGNTFLRVMTIVSALAGGRPSIMKGGWQSMDSPWFWPRSHAAIRA